MKEIWPLYEAYIRKCIEMIQKAETIEEINRIKALTIGKNGIMKDMEKLLFK